MSFGAIIGRIKLTKLDGLGNWRRMLWCCVVRLFYNILHSPHLWYNSENNVTNLEVAMVIGKLRVKDSAIVPKINLIFYYENKDRRTYQY